jgi:hypothetical protein
MQSRRRSVPSVPAQEVNQHELGWLTWSFVAVFQFIDELDQSIRLDGGRNRLCPVRQCNNDGQAGNSGKAGAPITGLS